MAKIARLKDSTEQERLIDALLSGATTRDIRHEIGGTKGKGRPEGKSSAPKPKRVFYTAHRATVIIQATGKQLTSDQCVEALREALKQANG